MKSTEKYNRIRPLKIYEILKRETDEEHPIGTEELRAKLLEFGIDSHRTTIYADIELLNECGYEIMCRRGRSNLYYVSDRSFNDPELRILMDAVQAASFITEKKSSELVDKIAQLAGSKKAEVLKSNIVKFNDAKNTNESIYYNVDTIIEATNASKQVIFLYYDYDENHNKVYRRKGHHYVVTPLATVFADGHYYLMTFDSRFGSLTSYRLDRMEKVEIEWTKDAELPPEGLIDGMSAYKKQLFGMFSGEETRVTIQADRKLIGAIFDLFGENVHIVKDGENTVRFTANVQVSDLFFGWCSSFGDKLKLLAPQETVVKFWEYLDSLTNNNKS